MQTFKAIGRRGDWFATINGEEIPCAWSWWLTKNPTGSLLYSDTEARPGTGKWVKYVDAIRSSRKVALTGKKETAGKWERDGYIGLFAVANIKTTDTTLEFDVTERLAHLK